MLQSLANERGDRPVLVHRLDRDTSGVLLIAKTAEDRPPISARFSVRGRPEDLLGHGRGRAAPRAGAHLALSRQGRAMGDERRRVKKADRHGRAARHRKNARRHAWRRRRPAFADLLRGRGQGSRRGSPGCR